MGICLILALSLISYDWQDISRLKVPPNDPTGNLFGSVGAWLSYFLFTTLGVGAYLVPVVALVLSVFLIFNREETSWPRIAWCVVLILALVSLLQLNGAAWTATCTRLNILPDAGGVFGRIIMRDLLVRWLSPVGSGIIMWFLLGVAVVMVLEVKNIVSGYVIAAKLSRSLAGNIRAFVIERQDRRQRIDWETRQLEKKRKRLEKTIRGKQTKKTRPPPADEPDDAGDSPPAMPPRRRKKPAKEEEPDNEVGRPEDVEEYKLPPISLLDPPVHSGRGSSSSDVTTTSTILVETLAEFGIETEVTNVEIGPVVTSYELLPAAGVRVEKIAGLSNNLALSLRATNVRVQAPIPGKGVVGVEVPNSVSRLVYPREIFEGNTWQSGKATLPLMLGKDVSGRDIIGDLSGMPHLLIAGATGSGKTVCMNSILAGLLMTHAPSSLRLMLVDPKIVEFSVYNHLPHLVVPVITDPKKVTLGLRWAINEMENRYKLFAKVGVRNIASYNRREIAHQEDLFGEFRKEGPRDEPPETIPHIVIVIDELADLMLAAQAEIENCIARLAQLSRAVGIHMIIATQRPSVNVITGTIKANFPSRIAFQVAQRVDSRTILDAIGADKLLGKGDMLFMAPGSSKLVRIQGAMTTDNEIRKIADFVRDQGGPEYEVEIKQKLEKSCESKQDDGNGEEDELLQRAIEIIRETHRASTSSLQRRLRIGYTRAARIMDILEERGILGPPKGAEPREILIDLDVQNADNPTDH